MKTLSPREREVLFQFLRTGSWKEVAKIVNISPKTVNTHWYYIKKKTGTNSVLQIVLWAIENRIIDSTGRLLYDPIRDI